MMQGHADVLAAQLRGAVGNEGPGGMILAHREALRLTVNRGGRKVHELADPAVQERFGEREGADGVEFEVETGLDDRQSSVSVGGRVEYKVSSFRCLGDRAGVTDIS